MHDYGPPGLHLLLMSEPESGSTPTSTAASTPTPGDGAGLAGNYSTLDRLLHRLAFAHPKVQQLLSDVENDLFRKRLEKTSIDRPVFITGLPRAGTTLMLEMLFATGEFSSYTYRQMPFVLAPLLWQRITSKSRKQAIEQERAHGDGMAISVDSPEAFEEILWKNRLADTIFENGYQRPLSFSDLGDDFRNAFTQLVRKMVALAEGEHAGQESPAATIRYLSKNNANLARLDALDGMFPQSTVLLCFRHPRTHVASLTKQHDRFQKLHQDDAFSRQYMAWTAHHDFGANFIPISFNGKPPKQPASADHRFWLQYWVDAYRHVLKHAGRNVQFISYEALLDNPQHSLEHTARRLELRAPERLVSQAEKLRAGGSEQLDLESIDSALASEASAVYAALMERATP